MTLGRAVEEYLQDHEGGNASKKTVEWHATALSLFCRFLAEERAITLIAKVDAPDISLESDERDVCWPSSVRR